jgi:hypothetical protein
MMDDDRIPVDYKFRILKALNPYTAEETPVIPSG